MNAFLFFRYWNRMLYFCFSLFSQRLQISKTEYKYGQYCTPLGQSDYRYFFVLAIKVDITGKNIEDICVIVSVAVGIISERLIDTYEKCLNEEPFFFQRTGLSFLFFFLFVLFACYVLVRFCLKPKVVHCVLSFWLIYVMLRSYMLIFLNTFEFLQS